MSNTQPFFLYILYSPSSDKFYVGQTQDLLQRIQTHNSQEGHRFTSKHQPWILKASFVFDNRSQARLIENYIKKRKSKSFIQWLIEHQDGQSYLNQKLIELQKNKLFSSAGSEFSQSPID